MMTLSASSSERSSMNNNAAMRSPLIWKLVLLLSNLKPEKNSMTNASSSSTRRAGDSLFINAQKNWMATRSGRFQCGSLLISSQSTSLP
jgi:hypothetical protein